MRGTRGDTTRSNTADGLGAAVYRGALRRRVGRRNLPFAPTGLDQELLGAADAAMSADRPLGVLLPFPAPRVSTVLGTAMVCSAVRRTGDLDVEVAVVSPRVAARTIYEELAFGEQRLSDFIPRTTVAPDGVAVTFGHPRRACGGRLHFASDIDRLAGTLDRVMGLVIDARSEGAGPLRRVLARSDRPPLIYLTTDPFDEGLRAVREQGGLVWGWDQSALGHLAAPARRPATADSGALIADGAAIATAARAPVAIAVATGIGSRRLDSAFDQVWDALLKVTAATRDDDPAGKAATRWTWGVFNILSACPVSPRERDSLARINPYSPLLADAVPASRAQARLSRGPSREAWYSVADAFEDALREADRRARFAELEAWIGRRTEAGERCCVIVGGRPDKLGLDEALEESPSCHPDWRDHTAILTRREALRGLPDDVMASPVCVPGPLPRSYSGWLACPPGGGLTILAVGPREARRAEMRTRAAVRAVGALRAESMAQSITLNRLAPDPSAPPTLGPDEEPWRQHELLPPLLERADESASGTGAWEPFELDVMETISRVGAAGASGPARLTPGGAPRFARARVIGLEGTNGGALLVEPNEMVTRLRGSRLDRVAAKAVVPGDVLYLVDRSARRDLLATVVDRLSENVAYSTVSALVEYWRARTARLHGADLTYEEIHRRMRLHGTSLTSAQTIGTWIRGEVDGPKDPDDIERFAIAVRDEELRRRSRQVGRALSTVHGLHRQAGRWLSSRLKDSQYASSSDVVDERLGLHIADLLDAVRGYRVTSVDATPREVDARLLGEIVSSGALGDARV